MPSAYYKVIMFFTHPKGGWSETYYTLSSDVNAAASAAQALGTERAALLASPSKLPAIRVGEEGNPRNTLLSGYSFSGFPVVGADSDTPWQAQLVRINATGTGYKRPLYMRGIPDDLYDTANPNTVAAVNWRTGYANNFKPKLLDGTWYIKGRQRFPGSTKYPILVWDPGTTEHSTKIITPAPTGLNPGDKIQVYKLTGFTPAPGICAVRTAIPGDPDFTIQLHTPSDFTYGGQAYYLKYAPVYSVINSASLGGIVHRDVGRPFDLQRGRRRAIRR